MTVVVDVGVVVVVVVVVAGKIGKIPRVGCTV